MMSFGAISHFLTTGCSPTENSTTRLSWTKNHIQSGITFAQIYKSRCTADSENSQNAIRPNIQKRSYATPETPKNACHKERRAKKASAATTPWRCPLAVRVHS
jgi:hypothetical protein